MSAENQDQDFEKLQRMLKLKRHELPPPRYFNNFSGQITARIRAGEGNHKQENFKDIFSQIPWLNRIWNTAGEKPALLAASAVCGVLIAGIFFLDNTTDQTMPAIAINNETMPAINSEGLASGNLLVGAALDGNSLSATAILPSSAPSLFNNLLALPTVPVSLKPHGLTNGFR